LAKLLNPYVGGGVGDWRQLLELVTRLLSEARRNL